MTGWLIEGRVDGYDVRLVLLDACDVAAFLEGNGPGFNVRPVVIRDAEPASSVVNSPA